MPFHSKQTGKSAIHPISYKTSTDPAVTYGTDTAVPGSVAAEKTWFDTTSGTSLINGYIWKIRNGANSAWDTLLDLATALALKANLASPTFTGTPAVPDDPYDATGWNGSTGIPTKNAVRDKIEALIEAVPGITGLRFKLPPLFTGDSNEGFREMVTVIGEMVASRAKSS